MRSREFISITAQFGVWKARFESCSKNDNQTCKSEKPKLFNAALPKSLYIRSSS